MIRKGWFTVSSGSIPMFQRINHVGVIVGDLEEARRWLGEVFGLPLRGPRISRQDGSTVSSMAAETSTSR